MANDNNTVSKDVDWTKGVFDLGDTALKGYFGLQVAKITAENARKAPTANVAIVGGVIVAALLIFFVLRK
jgi:hypothetical protein